MRFPSGHPPDLEDGVALNLFSFGDGGQKMLAAFSVFVSMVLTYKTCPECLKKPQVQTWVSSFLMVQTLCKTNEDPDSSMDAALSRIIKQNIDAKALPVSSLAWASIFQTFGDSWTLDECLDRYNGHPQVLAYESHDTGSGSIQLNGSKRQAVRNLLSRCSPAAFKIIVDSTHDVPFVSGAFAEGFVSNNSFFLGSNNPDIQVSMGAGVGESEQPLPEECYIVPDYKLVMTEQAQEIFFAKVKAKFDKVSAGLATKDKKKMRASTEELVSVRNLSVLFAQFLPHLKIRLGDEESDAWCAAFISSVHKDEDLKHFLGSRPAKLSLSMLPSQRETAERQRQEDQKVRHMEVETQRLEVQAAEWKYFTTALKNDQELLKQAADVPRLVKNRLHAKTVVYRRNQAAAAEEALRGYQDNFLRVLWISKLDLAKAELARMKEAVASSAGCAPSDVALIGHVDFNAPYAKNKSSLEGLCAALAMINEDLPQLACSMIVFPDHAREKSPRGLWDEERLILAVLFGLAQDCQTRFIDLYTRDDARAESKTNSRKFGHGVIAFSRLASDDNPWRQCELAVYGRAVGTMEGERGAPTAVLPRSSALLLPESGDPNVDIRLSERNRPSVEQVAAQKGVQRCQMLLDSLFRFNPHPGPAVLINLSGYVEDMGHAVLKQRIRGPLGGDGGSFNYQKLHYLSLHSLDKQQFSYGRMRVVRELTDSFFDGAVTYGGARFQNEPVRLTDEELAQIPGSGVLKSADSLPLQVLVRDGVNVVVHPDYVRKWSNCGGELGQQYKKLVAEHERSHQTLLKDIIGRSSSSSSGGGALIPNRTLNPQTHDDQPGDTDGNRPEADGSADQQTQTTYESENAMTTAENSEVKHRVASELQGVELLRLQNGKLFLVAEKDKVIPKWTCVGGYGTGRYVAEDAPEKGVSVLWPQGDETPVQIDMASIDPNAGSTSVEAMTLYKYLVLLERQKRVSTYNVSYATVERITADNSDTFKVEPKDLHKYKPLPDPAKAITCKGFFGESEQSIQIVADSSIVRTVFRFRFERVHGCSIRSKNLMLSRPERFH